MDSEMFCENTLLFVCFAASVARFQNFESNAIRSNYEKLGRVNSCMLCEIPLLFVSFAAFVLLDEYFAL